MKLISILAELVCDN